MDNDNEAPKDPGVCQQRYTEQDYEGNLRFLLFLTQQRTKKVLRICVIPGHRAHTVFVGVHMPSSRRSHRRHKHHHKDGEKTSEYDRPSKCVVYLDVFFFYLFQTLRN